MSGPYNVVQNTSTFGGWCQLWVEEQLTGHGGWFANASAAVGAADFRHTSDPGSIPAGVAVVFSAAQSNGYEGHTGVSLGGGRMRSPWSDGEIVEEEIGRFERDNGVQLLGFHNFGRGVPSAPSAPSAGAAQAGGVRLDRTKVLIVAGVVAAAWALDVI